MAKNFPLARNQTQSVPSITSMEDRRQKPQRPLVPVDANNATLTAQGMPHTPAEATKVPVAAPLAVSPDVPKDGPPDRRGE